MYYHLFFYLIWKVVKKHKTFFWESGVWYNLSGSVHVHNKWNTQTIIISTEFGLIFFLESTIELLLAPPHFFETLISHSNKSVRSLYQISIRNFNTFLDLLWNIPQEVLENFLFELFEFSIYSFNFEPYFMFSSGDGICRHLLKTYS